MKKLQKKYRHLLGLVAFTLMVIILSMLGVLRPATAFVLVCCWQLLGFAMSKPRKRISNNRLRQLRQLNPTYAGCLFETALTPEQIREFEGIMRGIKDMDGMFKELAEIAKMEGGWAAIKGLPALLKTEQKRADELDKEVKRLKKHGISVSEKGIKWVGRVPFVTDDCAKSLCSIFLLDAARIENGGALEKFIPDSGRRQRALGYAAECLGQADAKAAMDMIAKAALDATSTPLPTVYVPQIIELVWKYGQARQYATVYPLGAGTVKLPRLAAGEDDFGYLGVGTAGMSQAVGEKKVTAELVTFTANKAGGIIRIPTEIEEDTFIPLGQFLARYISRQLAKLEDRTMFLGDGTATYANQVGIFKYCINNAAYLLQLAGGKTSPTDATINDFRALRTKVNAAVLVDDPAYYMHPSMEALLVTFNTIGQPLIYRPAMGGQPATLDGFSIRWVGVMQPYTAAAAASACLAIFGALSYWYLGERGAPRVEVSREVYFATDELAMRALERIDTEAMAIDAVAALETSA